MNANKELVGRDSVEPSWFFSDPAHVAALHAAIAETTGTPFAQFGRVPGRGAGLDCVGFVEYVFTRAGVGQGRAFSFTRTAADYQTARAYLRILHMLRGQHRLGGSGRKEHDDPQSKALAEIFAEIPLPSETRNLNPEIFLPGDLAVLRHGGMFHLPIMIGGRNFVHCARPMGVAAGNIHDPTYSDYLVALFRPRAL